MIVQFHQFLYIIHHFQLNLNSFLLSLCMMNKESNLKHILIHLLSIPFYINYNLHLFNILHFHIFCFDILSMNLRIHKFHLIQYNHYTYLYMFYRVIIILYILYQLLYNLLNMNYTIHLFYM